ncbi:MAG: class I SAM-dependent methyltransferase, partial [Endomicrobiales bacterium]|nr:class I SAM-dependent methyltransferase [Endomicrobiales bacterium]
MIAHAIYNVIALVKGNRLMVIASAGYNLITPRKRQVSLKRSRSSRILPIDKAFKDLQELDTVYFSYIFVSEFVPLTARLLAAYSSSMRPCNLKDLELLQSGDVLLDTRDGLFVTVEAHDRRWFSLRKRSASDPEMLRPETLKFLRRVTWNEQRLAQLQPRHPKETALHYICRAVLHADAASAMQSQSVANLLQELAENVNDKHRLFFLRRILPDLLVVLEHLSEEQRVQLLRSLINIVNTRNDSYDRLEFLEQVSYILYEKIVQRKEPLLLEEIASWRLSNLLSEISEAPYCNVAYIEYARHERFTPIIVDSDNDSSTGQRLWNSLLSTIEYPQQYFEGKQVLIIGPGWLSGPIIDQLLDYGADVVLTDIDWRAVRMLRQTYSGNNRVRVVLEDINQYSESNIGKFDVVFAASVLRYLVDPDASPEVMQTRASEVVQELKSVMNDGGLGAFSFFGVQPGNKESIIMETYRRAFSFARVSELQFESGYLVVKSHATGKSAVTTPGSVVGRPLIRSDTIKRLENKKWSILFPFQFYPFRDRLSKDYQEYKKSGKRSWKLIVAAVNYAPVREFWASLNRKDFYRSHFTDEEGNFDEEAMLEYESTHRFNWLKAGINAIWLSMIAAALIMPIPLITAATAFGIPIYFAFPAYLLSIALANMVAHAIYNVVAIILDKKLLMAKGKHKSGIILRLLNLEIYTPEELDWWDRIKHNYFGQDEKDWRRFAKPVLEDYQAERMAESIVSLLIGEDDLLFKKAFDVDEDSVLNLTNIDRLFERYGINPEEKYKVLDIIGEKIKWDSLSEGRASFIIEFYYNELIYVHIQSEPLLRRIVKYFTIWRYLNPGNIMMIYSRMNKKYFHIVFRNLFERGFFERYELAQEKIKKENKFLLDIRGIFKGKYLAEAKEIVVGFKAKSLTLESAERDIALKQFLLAELIILRKTCPVFLTRKKYESIVAQILLTSRFTDELEYDAILDLFFSTKILSRGPGYVEMASFHELSHNLYPPDYNTFAERGKTEFVAEIGWHAAFEQMGWQDRIRNIEKSIYACHYDFCLLCKEKDGYVMGQRETDRTLNQTARAQVRIVTNAIQEILGEGETINWGILFQIVLEYQEKDSELNFGDFVGKVLAEYLGSEWDVESHSVPDGFMLTPEKARDIVLRSFGKMKTKSAGGGLKTILGTEEPFTDADKAILEKYIDNLEKEKEYQESIGMFDAGKFQMQKCRSWTNLKDISYHRITCSKYGDIGNLFAEKGIVGAYNYEYKGKTYVFVQGQGQYESFAVNHEVLEIYWRDYLRDDWGGVVPERFKGLLEDKQAALDDEINVEKAISRAAHILAWGQQIAEHESWTDFTESKFISDQLYMLTDIAKLNDIYTQDRTLHKELRDHYLKSLTWPQDLDRIGKFEESIKEFAKRRIMMLGSDIDEAEAMRIINDGKRLLEEKITDYRDIRKYSDLLDNIRAMLLSDLPSQIYEEAVVLAFEVVEKKPAYIPSISMIFLNTIISEKQSSGKVYAKRALLDMNSQICRKKVEEKGIVTHIREESGWSELLYKGEFSNIHYAYNYIETLRAAVESLKNVKKDRFVTEAISNIEEIIEIYPGISRTAVIVLRDILDKAKLGRKDKNAVQRNIVRCISNLYSDIRVSVDAGVYLEIGKMDILNKSVKYVLNNRGFPRRTRRRVQKEYESFMLDIMHSVGQRAQADGRQVTPAIKVYSQLLNTELISEETAEEITDEVIRNLEYVGEIVERQMTFMRGQYLEFGTQRISSRDYINYFLKDSVAAINAIVQNSFVPEACRNRIKDKYLEILTSVKPDHGFKKILYGLKYAIVKEALDEAFERTIRRIPPGKSSPFSKLHNSLAIIAGYISSSLGFSLIVSAIAIPGLGLIAVGSILIMGSAVFFVAGWMLTKYEHQLRIATGAEALSPEGLPIDTDIIVDLEELGDISGLNNGQLKRKFKNLGFSLERAERKAIFEILVGMREKGFETVVFSNSDIRYTRNGEEKWVPWRIRSAVTQAQSETGKTVRVASYLVAKSRDPELNKQRAEFNRIIIQHEGLQLKYSGWGILSTPFTWIVKAFIKPEEARLIPEESRKSRKKVTRAERPPKYRKLPAASRVTDTSSYEETFPRTRTRMPVLKMSPQPRFVSDTMSMQEIIKETRAYVWKNYPPQTFEHYNNLVYSARVSDDLLRMIHIFLKVPGISRLITRIWEGTIEMNEIGHILELQKAYELACEGHRIIALSLDCDFREIDIVTHDPKNNTLHFWEVKSYYPDEEVKESERAKLQDLLDFLRGRKNRRLAKSIETKIRKQLAANKSMKGRIIGILRNAAMTHAVTDTRTYDRQMDRMLHSKNGDITLWYLVDDPIHLNLVSRSDNLEFNRQNIDTIRLARILFNRSAVLEDEDSDKIPLLEMAISEYKKILEVDAENTQAYYELAICLRELAYLKQKHGQGNAVAKSALDEATQYAVEIAALEVGKGRFYDLWQVLEEELGTFQRGKPVRLNATIDTLGGLFPNTMINNTPGLESAPQLLGSESSNSLLSTSPLLFGRLFEKAPVLITLGIAPVVENLLIVFSSYLGLVLGGPVAALSIGAAVAGLIAFVLHRYAYEVLKGDPEDIRYGVPVEITEDGQKKYMINGEEAYAFKAWGIWYMKRKTDLIDKCKLFAGFLLVHLLFIVPAISIVQSMGLVLTRQLFIKLTDLFINGLLFHSLMNFIQTHQGGLLMTPAAKTAKKREGADLSKESKAGELRKKIRTGIYKHILLLALYLALALFNDSWDAYKEMPATKYSMPIASTQYLFPDDFSLEYSLEDMSIDIDDITAPADNQENQKRVVNSGVEVINMMERREKAYLESLEKQLPQETLDYLDGVVARIYENYDEEVAEVLIRFMYYDWEDLMFILDNNIEIRITDNPLFTNSGMFVYSPKGNPYILLGKRAHRKDDTLKHEITHVKDMMEKYPGGGFVNWIMSLLDYTFNMYRWESHAFAEENRYSNNRYRVKIAENGRYIIRAWYEDEFNPGLWAFLHKSELPELVIKGSGAGVYGETKKHYAGYKILSLFISYFITAVLFIISRAYIKLFFRPKDSTDEIDVRDFDALKKFPLIETILYPLIGTIFILYGYFLFGLLWATLGFAFSHVIRDWWVRANERGGLKKAITAKDVKKDIINFGMRLFLSVVYLLPFLIFNSIPLFILPYIPEA